MRYAMADLPLPYWMSLLFALFRSAFFNCAASTVGSRWRGESEKIVRCLFDCARLCAPAVLFMDEIDALLSSRDAGSA